MEESATTVGKPRRRRWWRRILRAVLIAYVTVGTIVFFLQKYLTFPGTVWQGTARAAVPVGGHYELLSLRAGDGNKIAALFGTALDSLGAPLPDAAARPTIIFFYGNGECIAFDQEIFNELRLLGFNVIVPDYEGYGMSEGKASEAGCYAAADAAYDYLLSRNNVRHDRIVLLGRSLGGAVAIDLANRKPVAGVLTLSTFTTMKDMAHGMFPWLPTSLLLRSRFDSLEKIPNLRCPLFIAHGTLDNTVPPKMSDILAAAAHSRVTRYRVVGADHNDIFDVGGTSLMDQIKQFVDGL